MCRQSIGLWYIRNRFWYRTPPPRYAGVKLTKRICLQNKFWRSEHVDGGVNSQTCEFGGYIWLYWPNILAQGPRRPPRSWLRSMKIQLFCNVKNTTKSYSSRVCGGVSEAPTGKNSLGPHQASYGWRTEKRLISYERPSPWLLFWSFLGLWYIWLKKLAM